MISQQISNICTQLNFLNVSLTTFIEQTLEIQLSKITENVQVVNFGCNSKTGSTLKLQEAYAGN